VAIDGSGRGLLCPHVPDPQGGHPEGDDLHVGPFEELGAVSTGPLSMVVLLDDAWAVVLEAVWLDQDAAIVAALLTGEPLPDELELLDAAPDPQDEDEEDGRSAYADALLAQAEAAQARADVLKALAQAAQDEEAEES